MSLIKRLSGRKRESNVWEYFEYVEADNKSRCGVLNDKGEPCGVRIAGKNPTNLKLHISRKHAEVHWVLTSKAKDKKTSFNCKSEDIDSQSVQTLAASISRKVHSYSTDSYEFIMRLESITNFVIETGYPAALVDHESFKDMQRVFDPKFQAPCSATVQKCITARFTAGKEELRKRVESCRKLTICLDGWSKKGLSCSFLGISACFFDVSVNKAVHVTLAVSKVQHPHTGQMLSDCLFAALKTWKISSNKILLVVTDNGANIVKKAVKLLQQRVEEIPNYHRKEETELDKEADDEEAVEDEEDDDGMDMSLLTEVSCRRMPCLAQSLQLVVKDVYNSDDYSRILEKTRRLVKTIRHSSVAMEKIEARSGKTVISDCSTRWISTYQMLQRLLLLKRVVTEVMSELNKDTLMANEWLKIDELVELLEPFALQTDVLQTDSSSLSHVIPSLLDLQCHLTQFQKADALTQMMLERFNKRFESLLNPLCVEFNPVPSASCVLDPTVVICMLSPEMASLLRAGKMFIILQASKLCTTSTENTESITNNSEIIPIPSATSEAPALKKFKFLAAKLNKPAAFGQDAHITNEKNIHEELDRYITEVTSYSGDNAFRFWSEQRVVYPTLAPIAEDLLAAPASQAYVNRIFSLCGFLTAGRCNRMSKSLEMRAFLKLNRNILLE